MDIDQVKKRYALAKTKRETTEAEISDAYLYTSPARDPFKQGETTVSRQKLFDNTAVDAVNTLVNTIMSYLLPMDQQWVILDVIEAWKAKYPTATIAASLDLETRKFFEAINRSDFYLSAAESMRDCIISGTGCIAQEIGDEGLEYTAIPIKQISFLDAGDGPIDTVFRKHKLAARVVSDMFKKKPIPGWLRDKIKNDPDARIDIIEAMMPKGSKFEYGVFLETDWTPVSEQVTNYQTFIAYRWERIAGDTWGDSAVRQALPFIKVANALQQLVLDGGDFASNGAWVTSDETLKDQIIRGGSIMYGDPDSIKPLQFPGSFNIGLDMLKDAREQIRMMLLADNLPVGSNRMTTDEVAARQQQFFRRIGAVALRLEEEFLEPVAYNTILLLQASGVMAKRLDNGMPLNLNDNPFTLETNSIVKRAAAMKQIEHLMQTLQMMQAFGPSGITNIDLPKTARFVLEQSGFPPGLLKDSAQVEKELTSANAAQAVSGGMATMKGQGSPETTSATGQAITQLMTAVQAGKINLPPQMLQMMQQAMQGQQQPAQ